MSKTIVLPPWSGISLGSSSAPINNDTVLINTGGWAFIQGNNNTLRVQGSADPAYGVNETAFGLRNTLQGGRGNDILQLTGSGHINAGQGSDHIYVAPTDEHTIDVNLGADVVRDTLTAMPWSLGATSSPGTVSSGGTHGIIDVQHFGPQDVLDLSQIAGDTHTLTLWYDLVHGTSTLFASWQSTSSGQVDTLEFAGVGGAHGGSIAHMLADGQLNLIPATIGIKG